MWSRLLLRGLKPYITDGSSVLGVEAGVANALGPLRSTSVVLTEDALLLATSVRAKTVLTVIPRNDVREVHLVEPHVVDISFDDYTHAIRRLVRVDLSRRGDRAGILGQVEAPPG
jgi:hypothetical protein